MEGKGTVDPESSGVGTFDVTRPRGQRSPTGGPGPEELIAAAHSARFAMALSNGLAKARSPPAALDTSAEVAFQAGKGITGIAHTVRGDVPGMSEADFTAAAEDAKANSPVDQALSAPPITPGCRPCRMGRRA